MFFPLPSTSCLGGRLSYHFHCPTTNRKAFRVGQMHHLQVALLFIGFQHLCIYCTFIGSYNGRWFAPSYEFRRNKGAIPAHAKGYTAPRRL